MCRQLIRRKIGPKAATKSWGQLLTLTRDLTPISVEMLRRFKVQRGVKAEFEGQVENRKVPYRCRKILSSISSSVSLCSQRNKNCPLPEIFIPPVEKLCWDY